MTCTELTTRILKRLGDDPTLTSDRQYYRSSEVLAALNQLQRMFVLLTLCLETTASFQLTGAAFYRMLTLYPDWIVPLRLRFPGGLKLRPMRLSDLAALDTQWSARTGTPEKYSHSGFDLVGIYKQNSALLSVTYARCPAAMTSASTPEIPARYHPALIEGAVPLLRLKEGQQEWSKVLPLWDRWMDAIEECAGHVRARNREQGYDAMPPELKRFDMSKLLKKAS